jgi:hypothetical protein
MAVWGQSDKRQRNGRSRGTLVSHISMLVKRLLTIRAHVRSLQSLQQQLVVGHSEAFSSTPNNSGNNDWRG